MSKHIILDSGPTALCYTSAE